MRSLTCVSPGSRARPPATSSLVAIEPVLDREDRRVAVAAALHAELIDKLESAGASDIVFDVDFSSPSSAAADQAFADASSGPADRSCCRRSGSWRRTGRRQDRPRQSSVAGIRRSLVCGRQCRGRAGRPGAALCVRRSSMASSCLRSARSSPGGMTGRAGLSDRFRIQHETIPRVSYIDVLRGDPAALAGSRTRRSSSAAPRSSSATISACPTAGSSRARCCKRWRRSHYPAGRALRWYLAQLTR